ncbi:ShlB/FhaC/HecB family hemolysin secretion/activation protein [Sedimenticola selenatireducens]|uniref:ShlB/FhaC/HecB family hemolysin secretion/activation protein n=1 Tax=Sedimenticola selenatireducens TaxID=191960 RepID=A0A558DKN6_9GAMM|nr:ShlB/FhaC/HecB family hemolysin secretion/activation protein [Sedimenticola selenatireducens]TVO71263.1 ShlB/FhaC/HecB family hemolysin secretion/activation protein [Sedimenticola selenatireducens]TVT61565.1 MAG: ShlB/FhaC/HecB family hemolysin secretion/activation protein [Sedimenticola selenatireducens]
MSDRFLLQQRLIVALILGGFCHVLFADLSDPGAIARELQQQQQRDQALRQQRHPSAPDARLLSTPSGSVIVFPDETPCFPISRVVLLSDEETLDTLLGPIARQGEGACLGVAGINLLMGQMQNRLVDAGYVTTRVLAAPQDLSQGELELRVVSGRVGRIQLTDSGDRQLDLASLLPAEPNELLDLRDLEQGLENLQRLPGTEASFKLVPGELPGESDLLVSWKQEKTWRVSVSLDDSGSESTGKKQAATTLFLDNPLGKGDLFYLSRGMDVLNPGPLGSDSVQLHYSIPYGYWLFGLNLSQYGYHQTVSGGVVDYEYRGESRTVTLDIDRVIYRDAKGRTTLKFQLGRRASSNFIDDIEIALQRRRTTYAELGIRHRQFIGQATLDWGLSYRTGLKGLDAEPAAEEASGGASARAAFWQARLDLSLPFEWQQQRFRYRGRLRGQVAQAALTPPDQFAIGNRWTVRGFDGQSTLAADNGWYLSNELAWQIPRQQSELFLGLDIGRVSGRGSEYLSGQSLAGAVIGARGNWQKLSYELFAGTPLYKPSRFRTDNTSFGFSLNWQW